MEKKSLILIMGLDKRGTYLRMIGYLLIFTSLLMYATTGEHLRKAFFVMSIGIVIIMIQEFIYLVREQ